MKTRDQPLHGWTTVLRHQPARIVDGQPQGGYTNALRSSAATAVTIPSWITPRSHPGFSGSAGPTRSPTALPHMRSTSGCTSSPGGVTGRGR